MEDIKINIGIVGAGWISENVYIPILKERDDVFITSIFDTDLNKVKRIAQKWNIGEYFDDFDDFLNSEINAIVVLTPNYTHADYSIRALNHKKHVLCEKPITISTDEVLKVIQASKINKRLFIPAFVNRFRQDILTVNEILSSNQIGELVEVEGAWIRKQGMPRPGTWFTNKKMAGGGVLIDLGSHILDICLMLIGSNEIADLNIETLKGWNEKKSVAASWFKPGEKGDLQVDVEDYAKVNIKFKNEVNMKVHLSWISDEEGDYTYFKIKGTKGRIELKTLFGFSTDKLWKEDSLIIIDNSGKIIEVELDSYRNTAINAFRDLIKFFVDNIRGTKSNYITAKDGLNVVTLIEELYK